MANTADVLITVRMICTILPTMSPTELIVVRITIADVARPTRWSSVNGSHANARCRLSAITSPTIASEPAWMISRLHQP